MRGARSLLVSSVLAALAAAAPLVPARAPAAETARSAKVCGACHGAISRAWEASTKSRSWTNPVFQAGLAEARQARGESITLACLSCHAPQAAVTGDVAVAGAVAREGITCNFCHNVDAVEVSARPASYKHDPSRPDLMRGPYDDSDPKSAHGFVRNELFTKSDFCASCHWAENDRGVIHQATYPQWKASKAGARGAPCQSCHMPPAPGKASPLSKRERAAVHAHSFVGPGVAGGLDSIATVRASVEGGRLKITVANTRAGHALPGGGHGMRAITLEARFRNAAGREVGRAPVATYATEFADAAGTSPVPKWLAASIARTREIPADKVVVEWAKVPAGAKRAEVVLTYHPLHPSFRARLEAKKIDLAGRDPVTLARLEVPIP